MRKLLALTTLVALPLIAGCAVHQDQTPSAVSGPAEAALSLRMTVDRDALLQDGNQSTNITVSAFDKDGHATNKTVRLAVSPFNFGTLSASTVTTPAVVTYMPPASNTGTGKTVTIQATVIGSDVVAASSQQVSVFVNPATAIASVAPTAAFAISPASVTTGRAATFDGSSSCGAQVVAGACASTSALTNFTWNFGDNSTASGSIVGHSYTANGNYSVTLTVTNDQGRQASTTQVVTVTTAGVPTAAFVVSPGTIHVNNDVFFNASTSKAATGHSIQQYIWNFGNGTSQTTTSQSLTVPTAFASANTYKVTLTVVDDLGQTATTEVDVTVIP